MSEPYRRTKERRCAIPCSPSCTCPSSASTDDDVILAKHLAFTELCQAAEQSDGDELWLEAHAELRDLHIGKSATYGTDRDRLANFSESAVVLGKPAEYAVLVRILDKAARAVHMIEAGRADEVAEYPDLASLSLCAEALRRRRL